MTWGLLTATVKATVTHRKFFYCKLYGQTAHLTLDIVYFVKFLYYLQFIELKLSF